MAFNVIWTTAGLVAIVNAQEDGFDPVRIGSLGLSPNAIAGSTATIKALTALPAQAKAIDAIGGGLTGAAQIHVTLTDNSADVYSVKSVGVYSDTDVLLAVYTQPTAIVEKASASQLVWTFDIPLVDEVEPGTIVIEGVGFSVPPATRDLQGVAELATPAEAIKGEDDSRIVTPLDLRHATWRHLFLALGA